MGFYGLFQELCDEMESSEKAGKSAKFVKKTKSRTKLMGTECKEWLIEEWRNFLRLKSCFD